jgi:hypothetical protein
VEKLGAGSRTEGVEAFPQTALEFVGPHGRKADVEMPCISGRVVTVIL